ncbi:MAG: glycosyltransferase family 4 protein [Nitrospiraceae bacterium]|nr:glycosyltransferase family 4 protein [Nitrospiraceae bacterium]
MKILLLARYFPPEIGTAANLFYELAGGLAAEGHEITVITGFPWYNLESVPGKYRGRFFMREEMHGFKVLRVAVPAPGPRKARLALGHLTAPVTAFTGGLLSGRPDAIFAYSPPVFIGLAGWFLKKLKRAPFVMGVQDLHPQCYIDQGILKNRVLIRVLEAIEVFCYRKATFITVHSEGNRDFIAEKKGISREKIKTVSNWIDTDEIRPLPRENGFSARHGLNGRFVVGYAGTLGMSQGAPVIIEAARLLRREEGIFFFIVGDGIEKEGMMEKAGRYGLGNVGFLGMQPKCVYPYVLASSDLGLVTLNAKVKTPVVPSKILGIMAAGRPVLASLPLEGDSHRLIRDADCGICVAPEDPKALAEKVAWLAGNRRVCEKFGQNGREYIVKNLSLKKAVREVESLLNSFSNSLNTTGGPG